MKFWEAMKAMEEGKKVRNEEWTKDQYLYLSTSNEILDEKGQDVGINYIGIAGSNWEIYDDRKEVYTNFYKDMYVAIADLMHNYQHSDLESEDVDSGFLEDYLNLASGYLGKLHEAMEELNKKYKLY